MRIYIDSEYNCHTTQAEAMREFELDFFDNKCKKFVECFKFVPPGETYIDEHGFVRCGVAWNNKAITREIEAEQAEYEHEQLVIDRDKCLADMQELIDEVLGG